MVQDMPDTNATQADTPDERGTEPPAYLRVRGLRCVVGGTEILAGIDLQVERGEYIAIMGPNGSGKTTLIRHLNATLRPTAGTVFVNGGSTSDDDLSRIRTQVGLVYQDPDDQMVAVTVEDEIAFGLESRAWDRQRMRERVEKTLERFDLVHVRQRATTSLSGGEQQRVAISAVWATDPCLLILDEPTSMLDLPSSTVLMSVLDELGADRDRAVIHVTQQVEEAARAARVILMDHGRIVRDGSPDDVLADEVYLRELGITRSAASPRATTGVGKTPTVEAAGIHHARHDGPDTRPVLHGIGARFDGGHIVAIIGPSGSGKTTLAWHLNRLLDPDEGSVLFHGEDIANMTASDVRRQIGFTFQRVDLQLFGATVLEDIAFGPVTRGVNSAEADELARASLSAVGLNPKQYASRRPVTLSAGEQRRVALAGVLISDPAVIVMDEPTAGLDARGVDMLAGILDDLRSQGRAIAVVTHDLRFARTVADSVLHVNDGRGEQSDDVSGVIDRLMKQWSEPK
jgi:energy-coupling factor transporter ATP-binding protein EcfA2